MISVSTITITILVIFILLVLIGGVRLFLIHSRNKNVAIRRLRSSNNSGLYARRMTFEKTNNNPSLPGVTYATEPQFSEQNIDNNQAINPYEYKGKPAFERFTLEKEPQDTFTVVKKPGRISVLTTSAAPNDLSRPYYKPKENK